MSFEDQANIGGTGRSGRGGQGRPAEGSPSALTRVSFPLFPHSVAKNGEYVYLKLATIFLYVENLPNEEVQWVLKLFI